MRHCAAGAPVSFACRRRAEPSVEAELSRTTPIDVRIRRRSWNGVDDIRSGELSPHATASVCRLRAYRAYAVQRMEGRASDGPKSRKTAAAQCYVANVFNTALRPL